MPELLTENQVQALRQAHKALRDKEQADRIKAILYLHYGLSYFEVAKLLMLDETTLIRYKHKYQKKGIDGLLEFAYTGGQSQLTFTQEKELKAHLQKNTYLKAKQIAAYVKEKYQVTYTISGMTVLLHRLGFVYKKPKAVPAKADEAKQKEFIKQYGEMKKNLSQQDQLLNY